MCHINQIHVIHNPLGTLLKVQQFVHDNEVSLTVKKTSECNYISVCMIAMAIFLSSRTYKSGKIVHVISEKQVNAII